MPFIHWIDTGHFMVDFCVSYICFILIVLLLSVDVLFLYLRWVFFFSVTFDTSSVYFNLTVAIASCLMFAQRLVCFLFFCRGKERKLKKRFVKIELDI